MRPARGLSWRSCQAGRAQPRGGGRTARHPALRHRQVARGQAQRRQFLFALVPGGRKISWPKLRGLLAVNKLQLPDAAQALEATGYERGTITPFGTRTAWPVVADATVAGRTGLDGRRRARPRAVRRRPTPSSPPSAPRRRHHRPRVAPRIATSPRFGSAPENRQPATETHPRARTFDRATEEQARSDGAAVALAHRSVGSSGEPDQSERFRLRRRGLCSHRRRVCGLLNRVNGCGCRLRRGHAAAAFSSATWASNWLNTSAGCAPDTPYRPSTT